MLTRDNRRALATEPDTDELIDEDLEAILNEADALESESVARHQKELSKNNSKDYDVKRQEEEQRAKLLHIETLTMMAKYQIVFIKMEGFLRKLTLLFKKKRKDGLFHAFSNMIAIQINSRQREKLSSLVVRARLERTSTILENTTTFVYLQTAFESLKNRSEIGSFLGDINDKESKLRNALMRTQQKLDFLEDNLRKKRVRRKSGSKPKPEVVKGLIETELMNGKSKFDASDSMLTARYSKLKSTNRFLKMKIESLQQQMSGFLTDVDSALTALASKKR